VSPCRPQVPSSFLFLRAAATGGTDSGEEGFFQQLSWRVVGRGCSDPLPPELILVAVARGGAVRERGGVLVPCLAWRDPILVPTEGAARTAEHSCTSVCFVLAKVPEFFFGILIFGTKRGPVLQSCRTSSGVDMISKKIFNF